MLWASWVGVLLVILVAMVPRPLQVPRRRIVLSVIMIAVLAVVLWLLSRDLPSHLANPRDFRIMIICIPISAALGFLLGAGTADKIAPPGRSASRIGRTVLRLMITVVLGLLFFGGAWFLTLYYINPAYLEKTFGGIG